ncbi:MAG TPA: hypothetical protein VL282_06330 [Tepidisphaeraceae bacterium]|nr:hypothetical protein [Tepidisphaeraceae bacterium]
MQSRFAILVLFSLCVAPIGCKHDVMDQPKEGADQRHLAVIPASAKPVAEGRSSLKYQSDHSGLLYLYDVETARVLDAQRLEKGQTYRVSADRAAVYVNDRGIPLNGLNGQHLLRIYVDQD